MEDNRTIIYDIDDVTLLESNWELTMGEQGIPDPSTWEVEPLENGDFNITTTYPVGTTATPINSLAEAEDLVFELKQEEANEMLAEITGDRHFVLYSDEGEMLIDCNLNDGSTIFGPNYTPDEATRVFWETIGKVEVPQMSAPPGIADDMPEEYTNPLAGWTLVEDEVGETEINPDLIEDIVKDIQATHFDKSLEGLIDG